MARRASAMTPTAVTRFVKAALAAGPAVVVVKFNPVTGDYTVLPTVGPVSGAETARDTSTVFAKRSAKLKP
jgi:hypothetical protein